MRKQTSIWENQRIDFDGCVDLTVRSLNTYGIERPHWVFTWSGGKDSTTLVTLALSLINSGQVKAPETITVLYADTRMELPPLQYSVFFLIEQMKSRGIDVEIVMAPVERRFLPYILGRGVPPPNNNTLRWCTRQIKLEPMQEKVNELAKAHDGGVLLMTGVRQGESAIRDGRIAMSCGKNGAECGQGWFQQDISGVDKLAPLLHWRVCTVWDWLKIFAPKEGWKTQLLADAYGGDEAEEINARTGCVGCPLASKDTALNAILEMPKYEFLKPLAGLRSIYEEMRLPQHRLRKPGGEARKDGSLSKNQNRMGPLAIESREYFCNQILSIQEEINRSKPLDLPDVNFINAEELAYIRDCWTNKVFPEKWTGEEPRADLPFVPYYQDGSFQPSLF
ncbi:phosphoadenosine phosphosulfate reductase [Siphonobacter sp. BAB-5385]|uniref:phosphoadenosine phosphosulfate reductase domain-containing protein n=1 Tax=Siphonobacter sp. BAB-5385 TaxID=1864822 RepID=UPI000B9EB527|nr:phosphoadenosine phosphosulfate reductase family protein [Siphonobacter sp. BAB-5385]OZI06621.1 phosphoadenosine phosphosulfate reductase [Siphonobacter sp. BAB-5385]